MHKKTPPPPLRGALAFALFALLAVSVLENAAAQTVALCSAGNDPHLRSTEGMGVTGVNCDNPSAYRSTRHFISDSIGNCGVCTDERTDSACTASVGDPFIFYTVSGQREGDGTAGGYCGPQSQCDAVGGTLEDGTSCTCASGNVRINGVCRTGVAESTCTPLETFVRNEEDSTDTLGVCECQSPNVVVGGVCEARICEADEALLQLAGIVNSNFADGEECVARTECESATNLVVISSPVPNKADAICGCPTAGELRLHQDTPNDISDDTCDPSCPAGSVITGTKCFCSNGVARAEICAAPESAEECGIVFTDGSQPIFDSNEPDNCRPPADNTECAGLNAGAEPIHDATEPDNCRLPADNTECAGLNAGAEPIHDATEPDNCRLPADNTECAGLNAGAEPIHDATEPDNCRLPTENSECGMVDPETPIFDENEPNNCRAIESSADCPTGQVLRSGADACEACNAPETPNTARDDCECPSEGHAVINGRCQVLAIAPSFHAACYAANWRMPIANSETPEDCRAAADTPEDVTACQSIGESIQGVNFIVVFEGVCANAGGCIGTAGRLTPEVVRVDSESNIVGSCVVAENCGGARGGLVNADNECRLPTEDAECARVNEDTPIHHEGAARNCVAACGANERHDDNGVCECDESTDYVNIADSGEPLNCQMACDMGEIRNTNDICEACGTNEVPNAENDACICANGFEGSAGSCTACTGGKTSQGGAACACPEDTLPFENSAGVCEASREGTCTDPRNTYNSGTNRCECPAGQTDTADGSACEDIADCTGNLTPNAENECHCNPGTHFGDVDSCVAHRDCPLDSEVRNADDNTCICADDFEGEAGSCVACEGGKQSRDGAASCTCPTNLPFDRNGECEASREGTCTEEPRTHYISETNECGCPQGQRLNADESACEAIPASGGGGGGGGGAAAAIIAVPVVLIGGYWLLGGFDYIDPAYDFSYSGENGNLDWRGNAGFNLRHGGLRSYATAIQANGDAVEYQSGISFERDFLSLTYDAAESESEYLYDFGAQAKAEFGLLTIAPATSAEFSYRTEEADWSAETTAGVSAAWTSHRWIIQAQSAFAGNGAGHTLKIRREL